MVFFVLFFSLPAKCSILAGVYLTKYQQILKMRHAMFAAHRMEIACTFPDVLEF